MDRSAHPGKDERSFLERLLAFFRERIWIVRVADLRRGPALLYRTARIAYSTFQGFFANRLTVRAAALTYYSVLSIVPFLAFAFAILKGFGAYGSFIEKTVRPYLRDTFGENTALFGATEKILQFVERTDVSTLGALGLLVLVYTSVSLLSSVEDTLNEIWGAKTKRTLLRQVTDYVTLLVTTPLLILTAGTAATAAQSSSVVLFLRDTFGLGAVIDFLLRFTSVAVVGVAFFALYIILPNVRTRRLSCAIGALVAAVLWQVALVLYVQLQVGVSGYNALYSVLSALPIFLVWTYVSWVVVLVGAQVAASHQNERLVRQRFRAHQADQALRETLAVVVAAHVAREFLHGGPWRAQARLAELVDVPALALEETLEALVRAGLLARADVGGAVGYLPGRDLESIHVDDLRDALRREPQAEQVRADLEGRLGPALLRALQAGEEERRRSPSNVSLRELAGMVEDAEATTTAGSGRKASPPVGRRPVLDAK
ncbi:MAG TPA: YihY/virulence factor BrkB family protein [Anaeromyxobacteraceae bacterium]|nr:YihY/virulence factor BrkB family protein [Anaeromyxobacteraceae bacterium]